MDPQSLQRSACYAITAESVSAPLTLSGTGTQKAPRILLLDSNARTRAHLFQKLSALSQPPEIASNPHDAIQLLREGDHRVILLASELTHKNAGLERRLRSCSTHGDALLIAMLVSPGQRIHRGHAWPYDSRADIVLTRPVDPIDLQTLAAFAQGERFDIVDQPFR